MAYVPSGRGARVAHQQVVQQEKILQEQAIQKQNSGKADDRVWVACDRCSKWRALPSTVKTKELPEIWLCEYNTFDTARNTCDVPEEAYVQPDAQLKVSALWILFSILS